MSPDGIFMQANPYSARAAELWCLAAARADSAALPLNSSRPLHDAWSPHALFTRPLCPMQAGFSKWQAIRAQLCTAVRPIVLTCKFAAASSAALGAGALTEAQRRSRKGRAKSLSPVAMPLPLPI